MDYVINISVKNLNETKYLAKVFSLKFTTPLFISLKGEIGTGKTTFANFFVNHGNAKASDVVSLIRLAKSTVKQKFGITLELEIKTLGFKAGTFKI